MAILGALFAPPLRAATDAGPLDPQLKNERAYFHCGGSTKLGNVNFVAQGYIPGWDLTRPAGSVGDGHGCGTADINAVFVIEPAENPTDGVWRGTFTGNLDRLTVHAHCICAGSAQLDKAATIRVRISIDGEAITGDGSAGHDVTVVPGNLGLTQLYEFSVTDIGMVEPNTDEDGDGVGDNPFGQAQHDITLTLDGYDPVTNTLGIWVFDTTEVPSGITFNPSTLAATRIPRP
jgi:hypothetical protein